MLNTALKLLNSVVYLTYALENKFGEYKGGFKANRLTIDQIFSEKRLIEKNRKNHNMNVVH